MAKIHQVQKLLQQELLMEKTDINSATYISQLPVVFKNGNSNIVVTNKGNNTLYVRLITQGQPLTGDSLKVNNNPAVLNMNVSYISQNGKAIDITKLITGN